MNSNKELIKLLKSLKTDPEFGPTLEFRAGLKKRLIAEAPKTGFFIIMPEFLRTSLGWRPPFAKGSWGKLAWAAAGIVLLTATTTAVMAQESLPTQKLYPVKIFGEQMVMAAAKNEWKPQIAAAIADRRLSEIRRLEENEENAAMAEAVNNYRQHLLKIENFRDGAGEKWAMGINRHRAILEQLEEKLESEPIQDTEPQMQTIIKSIETDYPQPTIDRQVNEVKTNPDETLPVKEQSGQKNDQGLNDLKQPANENAVIPEIRLTVPAPQNLFP